MVDVLKLEGEELDYWVAKVLGMNPAGKALCVPDYECGGFRTVSLDQRSGDDCYVYVARCVCRAVDDMREKYSGEDRASWFSYDAKLYGHYPSCFDVVPQYSTDWETGGSLIIEHNISTFCLHYTNLAAQSWAAAAPNFPVDYFDPYMVGPTPLVAAMRSLVKYKIEKSNEV